MQLSKADKRTIEVAKKRLSEITNKMAALRDELRELESTIGEFAEIADDVEENLKYAIDRLSEQL